MTAIKYFIPNSECTPFNCLFHCDSTPSVPQDGATALMCASDSGHIDVVQLLLSNEAQVDLQNKGRHKTNLRAGSPSLPEYICTSVTGLSRDVM